MAVTLNGRTYSYDTDFANWAHAGIKAGTGRRVFPDAIFEDLLAELSAATTIQGLSPGAAGNVPVSNGTSWVWSSTPGTTLAAQAITGTTLALSGGVTGATGRFGSSTSHSYILGAVVGVSADAEVFLAGMEGVTNGISYRRVAGAFEFRVATGNVIIADGTLSAQAITGTTLTLTGLLLTAASALGGAGFRLPHGAAPTAPVDGDVWTTTAGMFVRINGVTKTVTLT